MLLGTAPDSQSLIGDRGNLGRHSGAETYKSGTDVPPLDTCQCDEVWCFANAKDKNLPDEMHGEPGVGSIWNWTALCADRKFMFSWRIGARDAANDYDFVGDIAERSASRTHLTTDDNRAYVDAIEAHLGRSVDYAMLVKQYGLPGCGESYRPEPRGLQRQQKQPAGSSAGCSDCLAVGRSAQGARRSRQAEGRR
ncbi:MAG: hypothetical protein WD845_04620 [Pirellulales bacterium]